jgi:Amidohydrolase family
VRSGCASALVTSALLIGHVSVLGRTSASQSPPPAGQLALRGITIIDVRAGRLVPEQTIIINAGRIRQIGTMADLRVPAGAEVRDGAGKYVIPGLWDMHSHFDEQDLPQYLAYGVTGVRAMGDCNPTCLSAKREWQRRIETGQMVGARIVALSSFPVIGPPSVDRREPSFAKAATADEARQLVRYFKEQGVDFIKVYTYISRESYLALMDEARRVGLPVAGHRPASVSLIELSEAGQRSVEHAHTQDFLLPCRPADAPPLAGGATAENVRRLVNEVDPALCDGIFRTFVKNGTWWTPTLLTGRREAYVEETVDQISSGHPRYSSLTAAERERMLTNLRGQMARLPADARRQIYAKKLEITLRGYRAGVRVLVGTDTPFAGSSLHEELNELVAAGLTPAEVLKAATFDAAEFQGRTADFGSIETGQRADMVVLNANPLAAIQNALKIDSVILGGRYLDRTALDALLSGK